MSSNIDDWTNEEIRQKLGELGYPVGPATYSTRGVLIKKLKHVMREKGKRRLGPRFRGSLYTFSSGEDTDSDGGTPAKGRRVAPFMVPHLTTDSNDWQNAVTRRTRRKPNPQAPSTMPSLIDSEYENFEKTAHSSAYHSSPRKQDTNCDALNTFPSSTSVPTEKQPHLLRRLANKMKSIVHEGLLNRWNTPEPSLNNGRYKVTSVFSRGKPLPYNMADDTMLADYQVKSKGMLLVYASFFTCLALLYLIIQKRDTYTSLPILGTQNHYPICGQVSSGFCIKHDYLPAVGNMLKLIYPVLEEASTVAQCSFLANYTDVRNMSIVREKQLLTFLKHNIPGKNISELEKTLKFLKIAIFSNPHWSLLVTVAEKPNLNPSEIEEQRELIVRGGIMKLMKQPWSCYLKEKAFNIWLSISFFVIYILPFPVVIYLIKRHLHNKKLHEEKVFAMVNSIIDVLIEHEKKQIFVRDEERELIAVDHVRDMIIKPEDRRKLRNVWNDAVKYLEYNESRVRLEIHELLGDEYGFWRWLAPVMTREEISGIFRERNRAKAENTNMKRMKLWQGQAFETMAGSPNSLPCSPTPCLKLRHMFEKDAEYGDEWPTLIRDAVLEKCNNVVVVHMVVDQGSNEGCVYMKCASREDAGRAYKALHGWWFDTHLVTVKYLREERYHNRFPEAVRAHKRLLPPRRDE